MRTSIFIFVLLLMIAAPAPGQPATRPADGVEVVISHIEPTATLVSAKLKDASAARLFDELSRAAGVMIVPQDELLWDRATLANSTFSAEWEKQTLWTAMSDACEAAEVHAVDQPLAQITLARDVSLAPFVTDGAALIRVQQITRSASVRYGDNKLTPDSVRITMHVLLEPKIRRHARMGNVVIENASDENGKALALKAEPAGDFDQMHNPDVSVTLSYPKEAGQKLALLRGCVRLRVVTAIASVRLREPLERKDETTADVGANRLTFRPVVRDDANQTARVGLLLQRGADVADDAWAAVAQPFGSLGSTLTLMGTTGRIEQNSGSAGWSEKDAHVELTYSLKDAANEPRELRVELPAAFSPLEAKFEFKDLPLP